MGSGAEELGRTIGMMQQNSSDLAGNISADDALNQLSIFNTERLQLAGRSIGVALFFATSSFVIDHPVYGDIDSSTLAIDGDYAIVAGTPVFPFTFPATFIDATTSSLELWDISF